MYKSTNKKNLINIIKFDKYADEIELIFDINNFYDINNDFILRFNNLRKITTNIIAPFFAPDFETGYNININLKELIIVYEKNGKYMFTYEKENISHFNNAKKTNLYAPNLEFLSINHPESYHILYNMFSLSYEYAERHFIFPKLKKINVTKCFPDNGNIFAYGEITKVCDEMDIELNFV
jgi:hypothetical protein